MKKRYLFIIAVFAIAVLVYIAQVVIPDDENKNPQFLSRQEIKQEEEELFENLPVSDKEQVLQIDTLLNDLKVAY